MRTPTPQPLNPVGRDCDCGHPLVWHKNTQWCAVYGTHPEHREPLHYRNIHAYAARLVDELDQMTYGPPKHGRTRRDLIDHLQKEGVA